jgi:radical SAM protein with 4Fe4S-binding SPASM domain
MQNNKNEFRFSPSLCLTHSCNLNCVYCYQKHENNMRMPLETAEHCIDWIFSHIPTDMNEVEIGFIGGEPLLEFDLIKEIVAYTCSRNQAQRFIFYATTNGTVLSDEMKTWFIKHKKCFWLGLSIDGMKETHDHNRSNSFDKIDFNFFLRNWPEQGIKMTLSEYSLPHLADNIKFIHSLGFKEIGGVNFSEGSFDWSQDEYLKLLVPQLKELVSFYIENDTLHLNQMFEKKLNYCEVKDRERQKWCGIGNGTNFFDIDGKMYPCPFVTPMTFPQNDIDDILKTDFVDINNFIDEYCFQNCYIYPICPTCAGANYLNFKTFKQRDKRRCRIQKLIALFIAELQTKKIIKNPKIYDDDSLYYTIEAIKKIRALYLDEFKELLIS